MSKPNYRMNNRLIVARFWGNEELAELVTKTGIPNLHLTMIGLWAFADETGIFEWKPRVAASYIYPLLPEFQLQVEPAMNAMVEAGLLQKIEFEGHWYGVWPHWGEHNSFRKHDSRYSGVRAFLDGRNGGSITPKNPEEARSGPTRPLETETETETEKELQLSSAQLRQAASERQETDRSKALDRDLVLFWAENVSDFWPGKTISDKVYPKVAEQCDKYLAALSSEKRKALLASVQQRNNPTQIPQTPPEGDYDCACADPRPDTNGNSLEMYGASCTRCGGFVVRPRVFQIEEADLPKNRAFEIED